METEITSLIKDNVFKILKGLGFLLLLMLIIKLLHLNKFQTIGLLIIINLIYSLIKKSFTWKSFIISSLSITGLILFMSWLRGWGVVGITIASILFPAIIIIRRRKRFMDAIRTCEKVIYGKTKEEMKKGEVRPKIKINWKKKDLGGKK